jgi:alpha-beta hydrolase superfamily lysophospholipase
VEIVAATADGVALRIDHVAARGPSRGAVICLHAMMTDGRYFGARKPDDGFAHALATGGLDVFVADFRGHGRSQPPTARAGDWSFDDLVELDLPAIVTAACAATGRPPGELSILGHSLGGLVATAALGTGRIPAVRGLVLAATAPWLPGPGWITPERARRRAIMAAYRGATELLGYAPIRALRAGTTDESRTYVAQLTGWARSGRWTSLRHLDYLASLASITVPVWVVVGAGDWMCRPKDAAGFAARLQTASAVRIVGRAYGDALDPDHFELFTRPELGGWRAEVIASCAAR